MKRRRSAVLIVLAATLATGLLALGGSPPVHATFNYQHLTKMQKKLVSSELLNVLGPSSSSGQASVNGGDSGGPGGDGAGTRRPASYASASGASGAASNYIPGANGTCSANHGTNIKVNVNCLNISDADLQGRAQANNETSIAQDPLHPAHIVASDNDYVRGDGTCGSSYSLNGGQTWTNSTVPDIFSRGLGGNARQYWGGGGDTSVAWDTRGNAYLSCQVFNRGPGVTENADQSSAFLTFRSTGNNGASWNFPGRYAAVAFNTTGAPFEDKQLLTVDNNLGSPYQDRVYITWTEFAADGSAYIYETHSSDYGEHFSNRVLVSSDSPECINNFGGGTPLGQCNANQFSQPFVGKDGALYVTWANYNNQPTTGNNNHYQIFLAKSTNGGISFGSPVKISNFYDLPDCDTSQGVGADPGRTCVPEKGNSTRSVFRATNYPSGQVDPTDPSRVVVTFGSYLNKDSNAANGCVSTGFSAAGNPTYTGTKTFGACSNKILIAVSNNGGHTFIGSTDPRHEPVVTQGDAQKHTDQFWQWTAFTTNGTFAVDYYDRQYGTDEFTGSSDLSLSSSPGVHTFSVQRVTTSSMPPPTQFPGPFGGQFYGDYIGLTAVTDAHPLWSDTRQTDLFLCPTSATGPGNPPALCTAAAANGELANDQEIFTATVAVP